MDSRATSHLTSGTCIPPKSIFDSCIKKSVIVGDGNIIHVSASGSLTLVTKPRPLLLNNVLVTLDIIKNLVSVRRFTKNNTCSIEFDRFGVSIKDIQTKWTLLRSDSTGNCIHSFLHSIKLSLLRQLSLLNVLTYGNAV